MIDISKEICMGLSDNEIAHRYSLSIEFVRRQRKFLEPRAPVLPQQLKRGIFCEEFMKNVNHRKSVSKEKLKAWIDANPNGYMERSIAKIAKEADVSISTVQRNLTKMIAERHGISQDDVSAQRKAAGFTRGTRKKKKSEGKPAESRVSVGFRRVSRPSTDEKKVISGHFDKELYRQLAHLAIDRDSSMQALLVEALNLLFEKEDLPRF